jgi:hypothetical protein
LSSGKVRRAPISRPDPQLQVIPLTDGELAFSACFGPARTTLAELVRVAGIRWAVEMVFPQLTKGWVRAVG